MTTISLSAIPLPELSVIVFDLDDTLYEERDFVKSGFHAVALRLQEETGELVAGPLMEWQDTGTPDPLGRAINLTGSRLTREDLLCVYREHEPALAPDPRLHDQLRSLKSDGHVLGILTDGRSITQRNKLKALEIDVLVDEIVVSEEIGSTKPDERNYRHFSDRFPGRPCLYIGDNPAKDFVTPNRLGWTTVCILDRGFNIHPQNFESLPNEYLPQFRVERLS